MGTFCDGRHILWYQVLEAGRREWVVCVCVCLCTLGHVLIGDPVFTVFLVSDRLFILDTYHPISPSHRQAKRDENLLSFSCKHFLSNKERIGGKLRSYCIHIDFTPAPATLVFHFTDLLLFYTSRNFYVHKEKNMYILFSQVRIIACKWKSCESYCYSNYFSSFCNTLG